MQKQIKEQYEELKKISLQEALTEMCKTLVNIGDEYIFEMLYNNDLLFRNYEGNSSSVLLPKIKIIKKAEDSYSVNYTYEKRQYDTHNHRPHQEYCGNGEYEITEIFDVDYSKYKVVGKNEDEIVLKLEELKRAVLEDFEGWI